MRLYGQISKVEPQDDGTLRVYGYASSGNVDSDGEIVLPKAMKDALPEYLRFGAVREMHQSVAAGTAIEARVEDDGRTFFAAHVVDPIACKKVTTGTYKGFSIGAKVLGREKDNTNIINEIKLIEVSLVDRPANPDAVFTMFKAEAIEEPKDLQKAAVDELAAMFNASVIAPARVLELAKASVTPREKCRPAALQKGMGSLAGFAGLIEQIGWLTASTAEEASWEGDNSPLPEQLRAWLATGIGIFQAMSSEETSELMNAINQQAQTASDKENADTVAKGGARFSKASQAKLAAAHSAVKAAMNCVKEASDHLDNLGYNTKDDEEEGDAEMAAKPDDEDNAVVPEASKDDIADDDEGDMAAADSKDSAALPSLTKSIGSMLRKELGKRDEILGELVTRLAALEAQPMPAKGAVRVVNKGADLGTGEGNSFEVQPVYKADGTIDKAATMVKQIHATGGVHISRLHR